MSSFDSRSTAGMYDEMIKKEEREEIGDVRHLIANCAHDLKTPLASFMNGVDVISQVVEDIESKVREDLASKEEILSSFEEVRSYLKHITNTNQFMLLAIHRFQDMAKASSGMKLKPKYETIDLDESIRLPLVCMTSTNPEALITIDDLPEDVCSHVITDKQWLQENLLCLLSNAVKYSSQGGSIHVALTKENHSSGFMIDNLQSGNESGPSSGHSQCSSSDQSGQSSTTNSIHSSAPSSSTSSTKQDRVSPRSAMLLFRAMEGAHRSNHTASTSNTATSTTEMMPTTFIPSLLDLSEEATANSDQEQDMSRLRCESPARSSQQYLKVAVTDSGIGISAESMAQLFHPFRQSQRMAGGTGLGLYSLAKRVEALKGEYGVIARPDGKQGSVFWFSVPYRPDSSAASSSAPVQSRQQSNSRNQQSSPVPSSSEPVKGGQGRQRGQGGGGGVAAAVGVRQALPRGLSSHMSSYTLLTHSHSPSPNANQSSSSSCSQSQSQSQQQSQGEQLSILLADDSAPIAKITKNLLTRKDHSVVVAVNGAVAYDMIERARHKAITERRSQPQSPQQETAVIINGSNCDNVTITPPPVEEHQQCRAAFDILLLDLQMPVMDGLEAARRIRRLEQQQSDLCLPRQRIIGLSANSDQETLDEAMEAGFDAFIEKPFKIEIFEATVRQLLQAEQLQLQQQQQQQQRSPLPVDLG